MSALQACFKDSIGLHCIVHRVIWRNTLRQLHSVLGRRSYLTFFGVQDGDVFSTGLVNSKDKEAFHKDLLQLQQPLVPVFFFSTCLMRNKRTPSKGM